MRKRVRRWSAGKLRRSVQLNLHVTVTMLLLAGACLYASLYPLWMLGARTESYRRGYAIA